jgi:hypothetical protein
MQPFVFFPCHLGTHLVVFRSRCVLDTLALIVCRIYKKRLTPLPES